MKLKPETLEGKLIINSFVPNIVCALAIFAYSTIATCLPWYTIGPTIKYILLILGVLQFVVAPVFDHIIYSGISKRVKKFYTSQTDQNTRTELFERLSKVPVICAVMTFVFFAAGSLILFFIYDTKMELARTVNYLSLLECGFGSYIASCVAFSYSRSICTKDAYALVDSGINRKYVMERKFFGLRLRTQIIIFILIPSIATTIIAVYVLAAGYQPLEFPSQWLEEHTQVRRMLLTTALNFASQTILALLMFRRIDTSNRKMTDALEAMDIGDITTAKLLETDIRDETSYNHYLANQMLTYFRNILKQAIDIGTTVDKSSQELVDVSNQTETTAVEQSTGTSEILSTMEDTNRLSHEIEERIGEVSSVASLTAENVSAGSELLMKNLEKLSELAQANEETIEGIKEVNEKIASIWEIVTIINSIADQTKIIAFNAELEANSVRENGRSFKNVSNEIRRLANGTMDSTKEIKQQINNIQLSSDKLLQSSQDCTAQIRSGIYLAQSLEESFSHISSSAEENADNASEIKKRISQETEAFEQIVTTLQQISRSIESFSESTRTIIDTASLLQQNSAELGTISRTESQATVDNLVDSILSQKMGEQ